MSDPIAEKQGTEETQQPKAGMEVFTFGDPEPVLDRGAIIEHIESAWNGRWYEPPVSFRGLARSLRASSHHGSAIQLKRNLVMRQFVPHKLLSAATMERFVTDDLVFGNAYLEKVLSRTKRLIELKVALAKYMRSGKDGIYWFTEQGWQQDWSFEPGTVLHLMQPDIHQEVYGLPEYLGALQSAWLNESATLFRRRYYNNGSHAGFILYVNDASAVKDDVDTLRTAMKNAKGPGNFRNLFFYAPNGKKDGVQVIPISEVAAKDEFFNIKNVSRDDVLAAHRVPPQLLGMVPSNAGGFGSVQEAATVFVELEITPLMRRYTQLNEMLGEEVVRWKESKPTTAAAA